MGRLLYYLPSGHRTESHIPHLSLFLFPLCVVSFSHKRSLLFSAIPSRLFSPFFHPSGVHVCFYSHLSLSLLLGELHTVSSPLCRVHLLLSCLPLLLLFPSFSFSSLAVSSSISPSSSSVDSCLFTWEPFHPSLRALSSAVPT